MGLMRGRSKNMLKLRSLGSTTIRVLEGQAAYRPDPPRRGTHPAGGLWAVTIHLPGGLPTGSAPDFNTAKAEFKAAWKALKARITPEQLASAYKAMNIRDDDADK